MEAPDNDSTDKPVREQLQKTTIASHGDQVQPKSELPNEQDKSASNTKTLSKKRSFEDVDGPTTSTNNAEDRSSHSRHHTRKRSRDSTADDELGRAGPKRTSHDLAREGPVTAAKANGATSALGSRAATPDTNEATAVTDPSDADMTSPKVKRSRVQEGTAAGDPKPVTTNGKTTRDAPAAKDLPQTSQSAFAASGFGALASSTSSGFGALGKTSGGFGSGGGFASSSKGSSSVFGKGESHKDAPADVTTNSTPSAFGGALGAQSAFSSAPAAGSNTFGSAFARSGSAFGSLGGTSQLTSFASKIGSAGAPASSTAKTIKSKPFGAPDADEDAAPEDDVDDEADESGVKSPVSVGTEEDRKDSRFYEQKVETGEENEEVVYQCRAKLYNFATNAAGKKEWKERGFGVLKLNVSRPGETGEEQPEQRSGARFLMRADGSHRVLLNSPIKKELKIGNARGGPPTNGQMAFMGTIDGKPALEALQLKMKAQYALELYDKITELQQDM